MATYLEEVLADNPSFVLTMGEASGNLSDLIDAKTATVTGSPTYGATGPVIGYTAIDFSGDSMYFTVGDDADLDLGNGNFSIECWHARDVDTGTWEVWFDKQATAYEIGIDNTLDKFTLQKRGVGVLAASTTAVPANGAWHHYVVTRVASPSVAGDTKIYIDGVLETLTVETYASSLADNASSLYIGREGGAGAPASGKLAWIAIYKGVVLSGTRVTAHYDARNNLGGPTWTTPADTVAMSTTPDLKFTSPVSAVKQHFYMELDTVDTFNSGDLRTYRSDQDQTNWTYWDGASWTAMPSDGLPIAKSGNEVDYTVTSALSATTWYRRVRAGTLA